VERVATVVERLRIIGVQYDRFLVARQCLVETAEVDERVATIVERQCEVRRDRNGPVVAC
jgi:hypothetical protein